MIFVVLFQGGEGQRKKKERIFVVNHGWEDVKKNFLEDSRRKNEKKKNQKFDKNFFLNMAGKRSFLETLKMFTKICLASLERKRMKKCRNYSLKNSRNERERYLQFKCH